VKTRKRTVTVPPTTRVQGIIAQQPVRPNSAFIFTQDTGLPFSADQVGMAVIRAAREAGLTDVSLHTLRHTFISRLVQTGRPLPEVAALAWHNDITMTLRTRIWRRAICAKGFRRWSGTGVPTRHDASYPQKLVSR